MVTGRCAFAQPDGRPCRAYPGTDSRFCFWHDPGKADELADARRLGGMRRKRERTVAVAYDFAGLGSVDAIRRLLEIASTDALGLESSIAKIRALIAVAVAAVKLLETGELADRLAALEAALADARREPHADPLAMDVP